MAGTVVVGMTLRNDRRDPARPRLWQGRAYVDALEQAGAAVMLIPPDRDESIVRALYERCDAVCLPGGSDITSHHYGAQPHPTEHAVSPADPDLDDADIRVVEWTRDDDKPLLAICRGLQVLNVARGGTLWQDLPSQREAGDDHEGHDRPRDAFLHAVRLDPDSRIAAIAGATEVEVNSLHHQGVRDLGEGLRATAWSPDGLVEGVEDDSLRFCVGVQWHPEELLRAAAWAPRLFSALITAARR